MIAAVAALLFLLTQSGLASHVASHHHPADDLTGCSLCLAGSQFVAEPPAVVGIETVHQTTALNPELPLVLAEAHLLAPVARGPPFASA